MFIEHGFYKKHPGSVRSQTIGHLPDERAKTFRSVGAGYFNYVHGYKTFGSSGAKR